jgi:hypothetical protein
MLAAILSHPTSAAWSALRRISFREKRSSGPVAAAVLAVDQATLKQRGRTYGVWQAGHVAFFNGPSCHLLMIAIDFIRGDLIIPFII